MRGALQLVDAPLYCSSRLTRYQGLLYTSKSPAFLLLVIIIHFHGTARAAGLASGCCLLTFRALPLLSVAFLPNAATTKRGARESANIGRKEKPANTKNACEPTLQNQKAAHGLQFVCRQLQHLTP